MTKRETVIVSTYTGYLLCPFSDMHAYVEQIMGRPVFIHEMGNAKVMEQIRAKAKPDFVSIEVTE